MQQILFQKLPQQVARCSISLAVIVISQSAFPQHMTEQERSFYLDLTSPYFYQPNGALFASQIKGRSNPIIRIDTYFESALNPWTIEKCFVEYN